MTITPEQLEQRKNHIGASDLPAILGVSTFQSAWDIWAEKTGKVKPATGETSAQARGNYLEKALVAFAMDRLKEKIEPDVERVAGTDLGFPFVVHLDGEVISTGEPVECKSTGAFSREHWGLEGSDEMPDRVIIQCTGEMLPSKSQLCHVPVYLPERDFVMFAVKMDAELAAMIIEAADRFWNYNVMRDIPPSNSVASDTVLKRMRRQPGKIVTIPDDMATALTEARTRRLQAEKEEDALSRLLRTAMGDAEAARYSSGSITYYEAEKRKFDLDAFRAAHPELAEQFTMITKYRTMRFTQKLLTGA